MPIPSQPSNLIPRPFASDGTFATIPDAPTIPGRASFQEGFPTVTQQPLRNGGIAPNRMDFQGLFNLLTAYGFWQQSGGLWTYNTELNYQTPSIVFHDNELWWCVAPNGPETPANLKTPGTDEDYWTLFVDFISGGGSSPVAGTPVGTIIMYYGTVAPEGYFICDGSSFSAIENPKLSELLGGTKLPDMRGLFVRGYDPTATNDPDGSTREVGSKQNDAQQRITGQINTGGQRGIGSASGCFYTAGTRGFDWMYRGSGSHYWPSAVFDNSRSARTATENRSKNISLLYCIKNDK